MSVTSQGSELSDALEAVEAASPVDAVGAVTARLASALQTDRVAFLIADLAGRALVRMRNGVGRNPEDRVFGAESAQTLPLSESVIGRVIAEQTPVTVPAPDGYRMLAPVTQRGEVVGVLEVFLSREPDDDAVQLVRRAAHVLAFAVIANRRHTDLFEWGQRTTPFTLAAEIQRRLLPSSFTCEADSFTLAAWLEPAASIGGDTFDYSLARDLLHLSITDAVGHGVHSALTATLCVGGLRNARRRGCTLLEQAEAANQALVENAADPAAFVTGILGRLDLRTGSLAVVNAGHPTPFLVRDGVARAVPLPVNRPFGVRSLRPFEGTQLQLRPGDRLLLLTDGMLERGAAALDLPGQLHDLGELHPRELVRVLGDLVLAVAGSAGTLPDDACMLVLDWHGGHGDTRSADAGADPRRASSPASEESPFG